MSMPSTLLDSAAPWTLHWGALLVRPCERWAGDGLSGLPWQLVTGDCCGDGVCSMMRWESYETCPHDCVSIGESASLSPMFARLAIGHTNASLFGELQGADFALEYHCASFYDEDGSNPSCSHEPHRRSRWLESLLHRSKHGLLGFAIPGRGAKVLEFGAGLGQDSRNMARLAGWAVSAVEYSSIATQRAINETEGKMLGSGPGQVEFLTHDVFMLPKPRETIDFIFDATVYCGLRHLHLARLYELYRRLATPGHTLVLVQCCRSEQKYDDRPHVHVPVSWRDMAQDFEPIFEIVHSEGCHKNRAEGSVQNATFTHHAWCFFLKLKDIEQQKHIFSDRLALQLAARRGNLDDLQKLIDGRASVLPFEGHQTIYYISLTHGHTSITKSLEKRRSAFGSPALLFGNLTRFSINSSKMLSKRMYCQDCDLGVISHINIYSEKSDASFNDRAKRQVQPYKHLWALTESLLHGDLRVPNSRAVEVVVENRDPWMPLHILLRSSLGEEKLMMVIPPSDKRRLWALPGDVWLLREEFGGDRKRIEQCTISDDAEQLCAFGSQKQTIFENALGIGIGRLNPA